MKTTISPVMYDKRREPKIICVKYLDISASQAVVVFVSPLIFEYKRRENTKSTKKAYPPY